MQRRELSVAKAATKTPTSKAPARKATAGKTSAKATKAPARTAAAKTTTKAASKAAGAKAATKAPARAAAKAATASPILTLRHIAELSEAHELPKRQANEMLTQVVEMIMSFGSRPRRLPPGSSGKERETGIRRSGVEQGRDLIPDQALSLTASRGAGSAARLRRFVWSWIATALWAVRHVELPAPQL
jgi:DNA-binding protein HU-beta